MLLKSTKAEQDSNAMKYVDVILTEMDVVILHRDIAKLIEESDKLPGEDQDVDKRRKKIFEVITAAFEMLRPS